MGDDVIGPGRAAAPVSNVEQSELLPDLAAGLIKLAVHRPSAAVLLRRGYQLLVAASAVLFCCVCCLFNCEGQEVVLTVIKSYSFILLPTSFTILDLS